MRERRSVDDLSWPPVRVAQWLVAIALIVARELGVVASGPVDDDDRNSERGRGTCEPNRRHRRPRPRPALRIVQRGIPLVRDADHTDDCAEG